jgi:radical SAM superfamily enzyme YgiQ (UPF0313 family)
MMDENFLLYRKRAMELLDLMKRAGKSWELYVFASANALRKYSMQELVELGISWLWIGLESPRSNYDKLHGADTLELTRQLQAHGIKCLGSTIVGLEHHTPENIRAEIEHAVAHATDFHQFMLYTAMPGTPLYHQMAEQGLLLDGLDLADIHGQYKFNFRHPTISREQSKEFLDWAFRRDFERNGPSLYRICRTMFEGWMRYKNHPDARIRARFEREVFTLKASYNAMLWAMEQRLRRTNQAMSEEIRELRRKVEREFGFAAKAAARLLGPVFAWTSAREDRRLSRGVTYEPPTIIERKNWLSPEATKG